MRDKYDFTTFLSRHQHSIDGMEHGGLQERNVELPM